MHIFFRCDEPGQVGSPICMKDASEPTSTTASSTSTSSTPEPTSTSYFNRVELLGNVGNSTYEGNVYAVNRDGYFGPVCDDGWSDAEANVVCR